MISAEFRHEKQFQEVKGKRVADVAAVARPVASALFRPAMGGT